MLFSYNTPKKENNTVVRILASRFFIDISQYMYAEISNKIDGIKSHVVKIDGESRTFSLWFSTHLKWL